MFLRTYNFMFFSKDNLKSSRTCTVTKRKEHVVNRCDDSYFTIAFNSTTPKASKVKELETIKYKLWIENMIFCSRNAIKVLQSRNAKKGGWGRENKAWITDEDKFKMMG